MFDVRLGLGAAKLVTSGGNRRVRGRSAVMASTLTGRNLLSHSISLALAFFLIAVGQQEYVSPGQPSCVALGNYIIQPCPVVGVAQIYHTL